MKLAVLRPLWPFIKSTILAQARGWAFTAGGALVTAGYLKSDQASQAAGVVFFIISALLTLADNYIVDGKITFARNSPAPATPALTVSVAAAQIADTIHPPPTMAPQVTMAPIANPS